MKGETVFLSNIDIIYARKEIKTVGIRSAVKYGKEERLLSLYEGDLLSLQRQSIKGMASHTLGRLRALT